MFLIMTTATVNKAPQKPFLSSLVEVSAKLWPASMGIGAEIVLFLLLAIQLSGQTIRLVYADHENSDTLTVQQSAIDSLLERKISDYQGRGYWDTKIELQVAEGNPHELKAVIHRGSIPLIEQIHFQGVKQRDEWLLEQEFLLGRSSIAAVKLDQAKGHLLDLGYRVQGDGQISIDDQTNYHLTYAVKDRPELNVDALAAFNQSSQSDTVAWFGHLDLYVPNLDGRGKSIRLNWKRFKSNSEKFSVGYEHPWLFGNPLKASFSFGREVVDGNYQVIQSKVGLDWILDWQRSLIFQYEHLQSLITNEGAVLNPDWRSTKRQMLGLGYRQSNLDISAHKGLALRTSLDQELNFEPSSISRLLLRSEAEKLLFPGLFISQRVALIIQNQTKAMIDPSIMEPLGGVGSVRGYQENFLRSPSTMSLQHNLHLMLGSQSQLLVLADLGVYYEAESIRYLAGYGVGVQLSSGQGPITLILATHKGLDLRNSYLHIKYSGGVSWIDQ